MSDETSGKMTIAVTGESRGSRPPEMTPLVGRVEELDSLFAKLADPACRLLTLAGPGGVGKTRLAVALLQRLSTTFAGRIWFVSLAAVTDHQLVPGELARAISGVGIGQQTPREAIARSLGWEPSLLVLDNLEQIAGCGPFLVDLLGDLPALQILITSRESLRVRAEQIHTVAPLAVGRSTERSEAVQLFIARAQAIDPGFAPMPSQLATIAAICARVDGLPLAIELAAARVRVLSLDDLLARLDDRLRLLDRGPRDLPERQRTMRDTVGWSYDLLNPDERALFQLLSIFSGSASMEAIDAIWPQWMQGARSESTLDLIDSLVAKSLALPLSDYEEPRIQLLETMRAFGVERISADGRYTEARTLHTDWCLTLIGTAFTELTGPNRGSRLAQLDQELPNLRAAIDWSIGTADAVRALHFIERMWRYWESRGLLNEGFERAQLALALPDNGVTPALRADALYGASVLPYRLGKFVEARVFAGECLAIQRARKDPDGIARGLTAAGLISFDQGDFALSESYQLEGLEVARTIGQPKRLSICYINLGILYLEQGRLDEAWAAYDHAYQLNGAPGNEYDLAFALNGLGLVCHRRGEAPAAITHYERAIEIRRAGGDSGSLAASLTNLAEVHLDNGNVDLASALLREALELRWKRGELRGTAEALAGLSRVAAAMGQLETAGRLLGAVAGLTERGQRLPRAVDADAARLHAQLAAALGAGQLDDLIATGRAGDLDVIVTEATHLAPVEIAPQSKPTIDTRLSPREHQVLRLLADGMTDREIAETLQISRHTAVRHVANMFIKLEVNSRTQAAIYAFQHGLASDRKHIS